MKHARPDYDRIQDPEGLIPADEPVFLIRGCDVAAPEGVRAWAEEARRQGADPEITMLADQQAAAMVEWQLTNGAKVPDL